MTSKILKAIELAREAHYGQKRKYTNESYIVHPLSVALLVGSVTDDDDMIAAAILHDVVEDTHITLTTIQKMFGTMVANLVSDLTDVSKPEDGNRATRKAMDRAHTASASRAAKTIKLADLIDNTKDIVGHDLKFAEVYMAEKSLLLDVLQEGDPTLYAKALSIVEKYYGTTKRVTG